MAVSFFLSFLSAVLLAGALPANENAWLAWIALVPLLITISGSGVVTGFLLSYLCGIISSAAIYNWIFAAPGYQLQHHIILALIVGMYTGIFGLIYGYVCKRWHPSAALFCAPFIWVSMEFVRSNLSFLSLPFPVLGHSQYQYLEIIQAAAITGGYGISFLIVMVNAAVAGAALRLLPKAGQPEYLNCLLPSKRSVWLLFCIAFTLLGSTLIYGKTVLLRTDDGKKIRISVIQGNIDKEMKRDTRKYAGDIMRTYTQLTYDALKNNPDLIVWPEAATPGLVLKNISLQQQLVSLIKKADRHFLIGSSEYPKFSDEPFDKNKFGNTALFFSPSGRLLGQYLKIFLIPFGEYIPYEDWFPWPEFIVPKENRAKDVPGNEFTIFELDGVKFGVVICSEGAFPNLFRQFVKTGANFMLNITNEGWFGESALYQKVAASVFRAVENRISLARATNTGISCFIDPTGRVYGRVRKNQRETFVDGHMTEEILLSEDRTFYTMHGNIFAFACLGMTALFFILSTIRPKKEV
jgi:apolipoprotein N-acyltransferase